LLFLGDLPNVGYATQREKELSDSIMTAIRDLERQRGTLLTVVVEGRERWRKVAASAFGLQVETDALDAVYDYLTLLAVKPATARRLLDAQKAPDVWRMIVAEAMPDIEAQLEGLKLMQKWAP
jgi:hypothetical protein